MTENNNNNNSGITTTNNNNINISSSSSSSSSNSSKDIDTSRNSPETAIQKVHDFLKQNEKDIVADALRKKFAHIPPDELPPDDRHYDEDDFFVEKKLSTYICFYHIVISVYILT